MNLRVGTVYALNQDILTYSQRACTLCCHCSGYYLNFYIIIGFVMVIISLNYIFVILLIIPTVTFTLRLHRLCRSYNSKVLLEL